MTTHTPGPWRIGTPPTNGEQTIGTLQGLMVAVVTTGVGFTETQANARLIAAAPELLLAVQELLSLWGSGIDEPCVRRAKAAIAKATKRDA